MPTKRPQRHRDLRPEQSNAETPTLSGTASAVASLTAIRAVVVALRAAGVSFLKISKALEAAGIHPPQGGKWPTSALYKISEAEPASVEEDVRVPSGPDNTEPLTPAPISAVHSRTPRPRGMISHAAFKARFSAHLTRALLAYGLDAPERLLFMSEAEVQNIPGIGKGALAEIKLYRDQLLPNRPPASHRGPR
jgi:hypothetical protein